MEQFKKKMIMGQQEKLLSYNGELLIFHLSKETTSHSNENKITKLCVKKMTFDHHAKLFVETSTGSFSKCEEDVEMIHCSCISDFRTRILHPCVVLKKKERKKVKYMLLILHNFNKFELVLHFKLDYELKEPIKLLSGPTVLWSHAEKLFYISSSTCTIVCAPIQFSSIKWVGEIKGEGAIVLGIRAACFPKDNKGQSVSKLDAFIWGTECLAYGLEKKQVLTNIHFLPHAYGSVVSSVQICKAETVRSKFRTSVIAVTCKSQLIFFQDEIPKEVYQLPYEKPCSIQIATVDGDRQLVIVTFASEEVCAIWKHNLQVASCWKNVRSVLVDDFAGIGTEQILILRKADSISESLSTFQVTDFGRVNCMKDISDENVSGLVENLQENRILTIKGLEARLQGGFVSVRELQQQLHLKKRVLMKSCHALTEFVQDRKHHLPNADKEVLISLWDETEKAVDSGASTLSNEQEQFVEEVWYRVVEDNFVVGIKLVETFEALLSDVSLSLLVSQKYPSVFPIKCRCNVVTLKKAVLMESAPDWQQEPLPKRTKLDYQDETLCHGRPCQMKADKIKICTAVTHLTPVIALGQVCCAVLLHGRKKSHTGGDLKNSKMLTLLCGNVLLNLADISAGKYSICVKHEKYSGCARDLAALCAVSHKQSFQITSSDCTLSQVNTWLLEQMECVSLKECPDFVVCSKSGHFNGTLFKWKLRTQFKGTLTVFCRHQTVLFQCLHSLSGLLPPNCEIKHLRLGSKKMWAEELAFALEREMVSLRHSFSSALSQTENNIPLYYKLNREPNNIAAVQHFREGFKKEQQQSMLGMNRKMDGTVYRGLLLNVLGLQLNSDKISWQCSSVFGLN